MNHQKSKIKDLPETKWENLTTKVKGFRAVWRKSQPNTNRQVWRNIVFGFQNKTRVIFLG